MNTPIESKARTGSSGDSFFGTLRLCMFSSVALLIVPAVLHAAPWIGMLLGVIPLVYYHLGYLAPRAKNGLSQVAIDSVYYYGFLITISALGLSAVNLATSAAQEPFGRVAFQFGLGLFATGYAVFARMHLNSIVTHIDDASPEAVLDKYVQRSRELVTNVELASSQFATLANNLMSKSQEVAETARVSTEKAMLDVTRIFEQEMRSTLASARAGLTEIRGLISETSFAQEREELIRSVRATIECVTALNKNLQELSMRSSESARATEGISDSSGKLGHTIAAFHSNLQEIVSTDGAIVGSSKALVEAQSTIVESTAVLSEAIRELKDMPATVAKVGGTFKDIRALTAKVTEQINGLSESSERLSGASQNLVRSSVASSALADSSDRVSRSLPALAERVEDVDRHMRSLSEVVRVVEGQLRSLPKPASDVAAMNDGLKESLAELTRVLANAGVEAKQLVGHTREHGLALEKTREIASDISTLQSTRAAVDDTLRKLGAAVEDLHQSIGASTSRLDGALSTATTALETNVRRSSDAAALFTDRLSGVAQIIIEKTSEVRP